MIFHLLRNLFRKKTGPAGTPPSRPLREFVYLDEVSLRSLLSSQKGEVTDTISEAVTDALMSQVGGSGAVVSPVARAEVNALLQSTNSSTLQRSRKASAESWFREFHALQDLRLISPTEVANPLGSAEALRSTDDPNIVVSDVELTRGSLVEFRVKLKADPVFHLGTVVSEIAAMAEDHPEMISRSLPNSVLQEGLLINKLLHRLLVGLVPINGEAVDYRVVELGGVEYIVHIDAIDGLDLPSRPLELVGVTEQSAYWKDLRRILFSDEEFTVMCRISRAGLQNSWTPVKLVELFSALTPDLAETINAAGRAPFLPKSQVEGPTHDEALLAKALRVYADEIAARCGKEVSKAQIVEVDRCIQEVADRIGSVTAQHTAFTSVASKLSKLLKIDLDPNLEIECREHARVVSGLPLFPSLGVSAAQKTAVAPAAPRDARLLDVEVVAIYW